VITVDGSMGEGGGQIIRSSLALALVTGQPVTLKNIRARRKKPGLMRQHLTALRAAGEIGEAAIVGDAINSTVVEFRPSKIKNGEFNFSIGTAGSTMLVLQTVLPALMVADGPSKVTLSGGTHNPMAPTFDFLEKAYCPLVSEMGPTISLELIRPGFYPAGGGEVVVHVQPVPQLKRFSLLERGIFVGRTVRGIVSKLPAHIAQRECDTITGKTGWEKTTTSIEEVDRPIGPGNALIVENRYENVTEVFSGIGEKDKPAEVVAKNTYKHIKRYEARDVPVGEFLADQLLLPLGIGASQKTGGGEFRTLSLSRHSTTHIDVLKMFLDIEIESTQNDSDDWSVVVR
jgi:RNA 3'-terminal phosphate cyclase (ATP)